MYASLIVAALHSPLYVAYAALWIPISWNALFFILNGGMIIALLKERSDSTKLPDQDERDLFQNMFQKLGA